MRLQLGRAVGVQKRRGEDRLGVGVCLFASEATWRLIELALSVGCTKTDLMWSWTFGAFTFHFGSALKEKKWQPNSKWVKSNKSFVAGHS
jgi:hypothetical protein